jgi:N-acetylmuramic acid 6-phosphate (MurNAc-6-P) etherase
MLLEDYKLATKIILPQEVFLVRKPIWNDLKISARSSCRPEFVTGSSRMKAGTAQSSTSTADLNYHNDSTGGKWEEQNGRLSQLSNSKLVDRGVIEEMIMGELVFQEQTADLLKARRCESCW